MKTELDPKIVWTIIGVVVLVAIVFLYMKVWKPEAAPTIKPRPWSPSYGQGPGGGTPPAPAPN